MYLVNESEGQGFKIDLKYYSNFRQCNIWEGIGYNLNTLQYDVKYAFLITCFLNHAIKKTQIFTLNQRRRHLMCSDEVHLIISFLI